MTTIRAHVPVETVAGLVVALTESQAETYCDIDSRPGDVFDLAVPCPTCGGGGTDWCDVCSPEHSIGCVTCQASGYVLHGRYRVLPDGVLPIVRHSFYECNRGNHVCVSGELWTLIFDRRTHPIDLPAAAPGGVALIAEEA